MNLVSRYVSTWGNNAFSIRLKNICETFGYKVVYQDFTFWSAGSKTGRNVVSTDVSATHCPQVKIAAAG